MIDTLRIECLVQALENYMDTYHQEQVARLNYDGPSWGYFGRAMIEAKELAAFEVQNRLDDYVDGRVRLAMESRNT
jgi:hypothetical protein